MKNLFLSFSLLAFFISMHTSAQKDESFKPNGKPVIWIFTHFSSTFSDGKNFNKFDVTRAYLGYIYSFSKTLTGRITFDASKPSEGNFHYTGLLRFAYLQYHTGKFILTGGMLLTPQYELGNKRWGYRYVLRNSHDEYGFGPSSDLGISAVYNFSDRFSADAILVNGESYKMTEADSAFKAGIGLSFYPVKNLLIRGYYDTMKKNENNQQTFEGVISYEDKKLNLSAAYNFQKDHLFITGQDFTGLSFHGSLFLRGNKKLFARFDHNCSEKIGSAPDPWNLSKDGQLFLAGFEFSPVAGIRLAPNFQGWQPAGENKPFISRFFLNAEIKL